MTLREILELEVMKEARILAGARGVGQIVTSATVLDAPDGVAWLRGGELAFTSTYPLINLGEDFGWFIRKLAAQGVSGFGVKLNRYMTSIPEEAIEIADQLEFPIISLPEQPSWVDLINPIVTQILNREADRLERSATIHDGFTGQLISSSRLEDLVELLCEMVENPVVLDCSSEGITVWAQGSLEQGELREILDLLRSDTRVETLGGQHDIFRKHGHCGALVYMPLAPEIGVRGHLAIAERSRAFKGSDLDCLLHAQKATSIKVLQIVAELQHRRSNESTFVMSVVGGQTTGIARERVIHSGAAAGYILTPPFQIAVCHLKGIGERRLPSATKRIHVFFSEYNHIMTGFAEPNLMVLIFNKVDEDTPDRMLSTLFHDLLHDFPAFHLRGGISQRLQRSEDIPTGYTQAEQMLSYEPDEDSSSFSLRKFEDISHLRLFSSTTSRSEARQFVKDWLGPLIDHDQQTNDSLVQTLQVFLESNGNYRTTAQRLRLHHNSVRYRIAKIHKLLGYDVTAQKLRLQYELALSLLTFVEKM